jgi:chemotaxis signal transduction protein
MSALELTSSLDYAANTTLLVTMRLDHQLFGIPVEYVRDVLKDQKIARIPRAPEDIAGSINLRGRIVTVLNLRKTPWHCERVWRAPDVCGGGI